MNKLSIRPYILKTACLILLTAYSYVAMGQDTSWTRPPVTDKWADLAAQINADSSKRMLELKQWIPGIVYELHYATTDNFMKRRMYPAGTKTTYMRLPAVRALQQVQKELNEKGLGLKIFDAYRPFSVTVKFWELVHDDRYVANPSKGSGHNRGIAADLTIITLNDGKELYMGTGFDNFTDTAHHDFTHLPENVLQNRLLLKGIMEKYGFKAFDTEWWHYFLPDASRYEILDVEFRKLKRQQ